MFLSCPVLGRIKQKIKKKNHSSQYWTRQKQISDLAQLNTTFTERVLAFVDYYWFRYHSIHTPTNTDLLFHGTKVGLACEHGGIVLSERSNTVHSHTVTETTTFTCRLEWDKSGPAAWIPLLCGSRDVQRAACWRISMTGRGPDWAD